MKKYLLILTLLSNIAYGQSKKETIDWLNTKFKNSPIIINDFEQYTWFLNISQEGNFTIQSFDYSPNTLVPDSKNYRKKTTIKGNFKDLSPNSINTKKIDGKIFFFASCSNANCIIMQNKGPEKFNTYTSSEVLLCVTHDETLKGRCIKAFTHLITICGGKNEPF